jgi:hypothetical protein
VDPRRLRIGEWLAGVSGVVLLASLFLHWYRTEGTNLDLTAWRAFGVTDVLLALVAVGGIALAAVTANQRSQAVPTALASLLTPLAAVVLVFLLYRVLSPPDAAGFAQHGPRPTGYIVSRDSSRQIGLWIGLVAYLGLLGGVLRALRDPSFPRAVRERNRVAVETLPIPPREGAGQGGA